MLEHFIREYNNNRIFLSNVGLWPFQSKVLRILLPTFIILFELTYVPFEILMFYNHRDNLNLVFESCYQLSISIAFMARVLHQLSNHNKLRQLYKNMNDHWDIFSSDMEVRLLRNYSLLSQKYTIYYATLMYSMFIVTVISYLSPALLDIISPLNESRTRLFLVEVDLRINHNEYYVQIFVYIAAMIVVGLSVMVGVDSMHVTCSTHACGLFAIIGQEIENVVSKMDNNNKIKKYEYCMNTELEPSNEEIMYREYIVCLKKHQIAIKFVDMLNSSFETLALILLILIVAVLSLMGIQVVNVLGQVKEMAKFIFVLMGALLQLMIVCYSGQKLMDESQNIFHRVYEVEWYNLSPRIKSLLIITLYRSIVPCKLVAGNLFPLSMMTYAAVVRMGMSYFTAFLSFKD